MVDPAYVQALEAECNKFKQLYGSLLIVCEEAKVGARRGAELEAENARLQATQAENLQLRSEIAAARTLCNDYSSQGGEDVSRCREQLAAVQTVNGTLNGEVRELQRRLRAVQRLRSDEMRPSACVVCLERAANSVSLPCKHLALCNNCGARPDVTCCPICRCEIEDRVDVFLP